MAILKIKDAEGNVIDIPAIRGKSAYEYAKEGGFKGTEEEFKSLLGGLQDWADNALESSSNVSYATCDTEAEIAEKTVTISNNDNWKLNVGTVVMIYFSISNSASNVKLNVNGTGAYPIWYNNAEYTSTGTAYTGYAKRVIVYMFNGTHWVWISSSYDTNTTYTNASLGQGYVTCSTDASTTAKVGALSSYKLVTGGIVSVKFTNAVPANATLNVNSTGAKAIYYRGAKITADVIKAGDVATFIYSSQYHLISIDRWQNDITSLEEEITDYILVVTKAELEALTQEELAEKYSKGTRLIVTEKKVYNNLVPVSVNKNGVLFNSCGYMNNYCFDSTGEKVAKDSAVITGFMTYTHGSIIRVTGSVYHDANSSARYFAVYDADMNLIECIKTQSLITTYGAVWVRRSDGLYQLTLDTSKITNWSNAKYFRISEGMCYGANLIVTANQEIGEV